uniref:Uncharacterized protein n=1 Tax=Chromera velia CCMP2878 TaxID=1169474 RepID=A0A0G4FJZ3_9ALVE|eukprot:Cvel_3408.t1-p1 / transcript=Cvel_3408.t1 / gene=Cvel_3408 / organism=Chromera_velia_CCMP2878 / gene_product=hypothetical protein / transcript_product=hypothetical protein / location=Cvel_scaffold137:26350-26952(+) / protein_length=201 / sequence_SO=supercontig / SO=protein_coding / is_pseudo=false
MLRRGFKQKTCDSTSTDEYSDQLTAAILRSSTRFACFSPLGPKTLNAFFANEDSFLFTAREALSLCLPESPTDARRSALRILPCHSALEVSTSSLDSLMSSSICPSRAVVGSKGGADCQDAGTTFAFSVCFPVLSLFPVSAAATGAVTVPPAVHSRAPTCSRQQSFSSCTSPPQQCHSEAHTCGLSSHPRRLRNMGMHAPA